MRWKFWKSRGSDAVCSGIHSRLQSSVREGSALTKDDAIERHLTECATCREEWNAWQVMHTAMKLSRTALPVEEFWESYKKEVIRRIDEPAVSQPVRATSSWAWITMGWRPVYAAALFITIISAGLMMNRRSAMDSKSQMSTMAQNNLIEFCIDEFDEVAREETIVEPLPTSFVNTQKK